MVISFLPPYIICIVAIFASLIVSLYTIKKVIFITKKRNIYDIPDNIRKIHGSSIPSLGGIGIFAGYIVVASFFMFDDYWNLHYTFISSAILFFTGIYDDIMDMRPVKKLSAQLLASFIAVYFTLMPAFYHDATPEKSMIVYWSLVGCMTIACTFFINAFNFIDGIDGLAASLGILYTLILAILYALGGQAGAAAIMFSLVGAIAGLLYYNRPPAKIYMGDTGSMMMGFNVFIFAALCPFISPMIDIKVIDRAVPFILLSLLFLPAYDAIRVFILRLSKSRSPLKADRNHLHYYLLDAGFSHSRAVLIITATNLLLIGLAFVLWPLNIIIVLLIYTVVVSAVLFVIYRLRQRKLSE